MIHVLLISPHTALKSIDKSSFIDMLKTGGAGDSERTDKKARTTKVRRQDCGLEGGVGLCIEFLGSLYIKRKGGEGGR